MKVSNFKKLIGNLNVIFKANRHQPKPMIWITNDFITDYIKEHQYLASFISGIINHIIVTTIYSRDYTNLTSNGNCNINRFPTIKYLAFIESADVS